MAFRNIREFFEKLVFAGLKPDAPAGPKKSIFQRWMQSAEDLASKGLRPDEAPLPGPTTWKKKAGMILSVIAVGVGVYFLVDVLQSHADKPESQTTGAVAPIVPPNFKVEKNKDLAVEEIEFNKNVEPKVITGTLKNLTDKTFVACDVSFDLTTKGGTQLGGVATTVRDLGPHGSAKFRIQVSQPEAAFALVRELRPE
jgi:hypothetical protein